MTPPAPVPDSFAAFWPIYVAEHCRAGNRALHYAGGGLALASVAYAACALDWRALLAAPCVGYAFAWVGHFAIEGNRPATWRWPMWSLRGEARMLWYGLTGRMRAEVRAHTGR